MHGDGVHIGGRRSAGLGGVHELVNPANDEPTGTIQHAGPEDVIRACESATAAQRLWGETTPAQRFDALQRWADAIAADATTLVGLEVEDTGKPRAVFADGELPFAVDNLRFFAAAARSLDGSAGGVLSSGYLSILLRRPLGVVAGITPWNFPLIMSIWKAGPALAAGNAIVLKPAPATPRSTLRLADLAIEAGLPPGLVNVVTGDATTGLALVTNPQIAMVSVTGSTQTGQAVMRAAAPATKRLHLELGGKAPAVVFEDADISALARAVTLGATYNTGQDCTAATRVYVQASIYDATVEALRVAMASVRIGDPFATETDIGPLISRAHRDRVHQHVRRAVDEGASLIHGGSIPEGRGAYYPPTLLIGARQDSAIVQDEVFGPVLVVLPFHTEDEAVTLANDCRYALASSVWTTDVGRALRIAPRIIAGVTWINDHLPIASEAPHGGTKSSGFGKDMGHESVLEYSMTQHVMVRTSPPVEHDSFRPA